MMERSISRDMVRKVILEGEIIEDYPDDKPYPSALFFKYIENDPVHVVVSFDVQTNYCMIITAYRPDIDHFKPDYKTRRRYEN